MCMDLKPLNPTADAPRYTEGLPKGQPEWGRYNWSGWGWLIDLLEKWGIDTHEFADCNDGDVISAETCVKVADAIEAHLPELDERDRKWLQGHAILWRTCGGYAQY